MHLLTGCSERAAWCWWAKGNPHSSSADTAHTCTTTLTAGLLLWAPVQIHYTTNPWNSPGGDMFVIDGNIPKTAKKWVFNWKPRDVQICYKKQGGKTKLIRIILKNINYCKAFKRRWMIQGYMNGWDLITWNFAKVEWLIHTSRRRGLKFSGIVTLCAHL